MSDISACDPLEVLLRGDLPDMRKQLPRCKVELPRLSKLAGAPVIFELRGLTYREICDIQSSKADQSLRAVLAGCIVPDWRRPELAGGDSSLATPLDVIQAKLLPGEIEDLYVKINHLSGYLRATIVDAKNA